MPLLQADLHVHDVLNVFMCTGVTHDTHQYFMTNAWAGAARGIATGTAKRNTAAAITAPVKKKRLRRRS